MFSASISEGFGSQFGMVFGKFFESKMHENCKNTILAKTLKIVIFRRENTHFQEIEDCKKKKTSKNRRKNTCFLGRGF